MNVNSITIPAPMQLLVDDIGCMDGRIPYWADWNPNRTGMPRKHVLEDYIALNEIGRAIGMKINVLFVIGEWDKYNKLRKVPYATRPGWDHTQFLDEEEAVKIRDYLNTCEYIEIGLHGTLHEAWDENGEYVGGEFSLTKDFLPRSTKPTPPKVPVPEWYMRAHLDAFMELYKDWGFTQEIRSFTCPGECCGAYDTDYFAKTLSEYGIKYCHEGDAMPMSFAKDGIISNTRTGSLAPWEAYDINPAKLPVFQPDEAAMMGAHWPNFLRYDPDENLERLDAWKAYFERHAEVFGIMISRDLAMAHHQLLYRKFGTVEECGARVKIDLSKVDEMAPWAPKEPLYISVKNGSEPVSCEGGVLTEYESRKEFKTYRIDRTEASVIYLQ